MATGTLACERFESKYCSPEQADESLDILPTLDLGFNDSEDDVVSSGHGAALNVLFNCKQCGQGFTSRAERINHACCHTYEEVSIVTSSISRDQIECDEEQEEEVEQQSTLAGHRRPPAPKTPKVPSHKCNVCNESFRSWTDMRKHIEDHPRKKCYTCLDCKQDFTYQSELRKHKCGLMSDGTFRCMEPDCDPEREFLSARSLAGHKRKHKKDGEKEGSLPCPPVGECKRPCRVQRGLEDLGSRIHSAKPPFACSNEGCREAFGFQGHLRQHLRVCKHRVMT